MIGIGMGDIEHRHGDERHEQVIGASFTRCAVFPVQNIADGEGYQSAVRLKEGMSKGMEPIGVDGFAGLNESAGN